MILCSVVPLVLYAVGIVTAPILALLAFAFSAALFLGTLIIGDREQERNCGEDFMSADAAVLLSGGAAVF